MNTDTPWGGYFADLSNSELYCFAHIHPDCCMRSAASSVLYIRHRDSSVRALHLNSGCDIDTASAVYQEAAIQLLAKPPVAAPRGDPEWYETLLSETIWRVYKEWRDS